MNQELISSYLELFRGRHDVYAVPNAFKKESHSDEFYRARVKDHLAGKKRMGQYTHLADDSCYWAVVEFEKHEKTGINNPFDSCIAFRDKSASFGLKSFIEKSKGEGENYHLWFFCYSKLSDSVHI